MPSFHSSQFKTTDIIIRTFIMSILNLQRKIAHIQMPAFADNQTPFYHIPQFTDISFPGLLFQRMKKSRSHLIDRIRKFLGKALCKGSGKNSDITGTFAKCRQMYLKYRKTIKQVFTETSRFDFLCQIAVGSSNNTNIHVRRFRISYLYIFACFENTQQFGL